MTAVPVATYLVEFAAQTDSKSHELPDSPSWWNAPAARAEARDRALEDAFQRGLAAGRAEARARLEQELAEQRGRQEEERAAERLAWAGEEAGRLADSLTAGLDEIGAEIASIAARILEPFVVGETFRRAQDELGALIEELVARQQGVSIEIRGSPDLIEALTLRLQGTGVRIASVASDSCDAHVRCNHTLIETRLSAWLARLREIPR